MSDTGPLPRQEDPPTVSPRPWKRGRARSPAAERSPRPVELEVVVFDGEARFRGTMRAEGAASRRAFVRAALLCEPGETLTIELDRRGGGVVRARATVVRTERGDAEPGMEVEWTDFPTKERAMVSMPGGRARR
ncbi:MAG: hypothetical protein AABZ30_10205 [Myxococcota bacterium]